MLLERLQLNKDTGNIAMKAVYASESVEECSKYV